MAENNDVIIYQKNPVETAWRIHNIHTLRAGINRTNTVTLGVIYNTKISKMFVWQKASWCTHVEVEHGDALTKCMEEALLEHTGATGCARWKREA